MNLDKKHESDDILPQKNTHTHTTQNHSKYYEIYKKNRVKSLHRSKITQIIDKE